jgi:hypothetical protein
LLPSTSGRTWGWSAQKYALIHGISLPVIRPLNMMLFGGLSDRMSARGVKAAPLRILYLGFFIMVPSGALPLRQRRRPRLARGSCCSSTHLPITDRTWHALAASGSVCAVRWNDVPAALFVIAAGRLSVAKSP